MARDVWVFMVWGSLYPHNFLTGWDIQYFSPPFGVLVQVYDANERTYGTGIVAEFGFKDSAHGRHTKGRRFECIKRPANGIFQHRQVESIRLEIHQNASMPLREES